MTDNGDDKISPVTENWSPGGRILGFGHPRFVSLRTVHPPVPQIFQLWQIFLINVNPIVMCFHAPSIQQMISEAVSDLGNLAHSTEALLFSIYLSSVASVSDDVCQRVLGETRSDLVLRFSEAAEQALVNAEFLRSTNIHALQALTLYLLATRRLYDPHTLWLLTGIPNRIGRAMGLHREDSLRSFSAFEREIRRRLWWQIVIMDTRSAQLSGVAVDPSFNLSWDTKRPLNLSDSDLCPSMEVLPAESEGPTEMLFCEIRFEIGECIRQLTVMETGEMGPSNVMPLAEEGRAIDTLETRLEARYLRKCDSSIPFHLLAMYLGRSSVCQMRLAIFHPQRYPDKGATLAPDEKDRLFSLGLQILEFDNLTYSNTRLRPYLWHVAMSFPFEAFILVLTELVTRVQGDSVDRAWAKVSQVYEDHPELITASKTNTLFFALGGLTIRAWKERAAAVQKHSSLYLPIEPPFIIKLRVLRDDSPGQEALYTNASEPAVPQVAGHLAAGEMDHVMSRTPLATDMTQIDWEYWQNLIGEQGDFFQ
ncbi:hypothetical protein PHISCL_08887 [Aspergillus sclerotialis]|uniref:Xylanolytic transcriptional activator regulatory domain-containing protein n=1 Tax=Aspergillus sclerotialis TaxID=2070753 RepID=A0A3A2Z967_9EURO|nr:hypothetical protein PHISCL_08887 [Aspergillus sclerotialis]